MLFAESAALRLENASVETIGSFRKVGFVPKRAHRLGNYPNASRMLQSFELACFAKVWSPRFMVSFIARSQAPTYESKKL